MAILAYANLFVHWPTWAAVTATAAAIWAFWEQLVSRAKATADFLEAWKKYRLASAEFKAYRREQKIMRLLETFRLHKFKLQQKHRGAPLEAVTPPRAHWWENRALIDEAWRRLLAEEQQQKPPGAYREPDSPSRWRRPWQD